jgi:hypothetical protein
MESDRISTTADFADLQQHCRFPFSVVLFGYIYAVFARVGLPKGDWKFDPARLNRAIGE